MIITNSTQGSNVNKVYDEGENVGFHCKNIAVPHSVMKWFQLPQSQHKVLMYTKFMEKEKIDCRCKTVSVAHSFMKCHSMNTKSTQGSDVQKVDGEGKMLTIVVKPLLLLTMAWPFIARFMQKRITLVDTFFWASEEG